MGTKIVLMGRGALGRVIQHACAHDFVVANAEAEELGCSPRAIRHAVERGLLETVHPGVHRLRSAVELTTRGRARAALHYIGGNAAVARQTAAELWGLPLRRLDRRIHLLNDIRSGPVPTSIVLHRTRRHLDQHVAVLDGLRITTTARTLCDLALEPRFGWDELRRLTSAALRTEAMSLDDLGEALFELPRFRGRKVVEGILNELSPLETATRSELESLFVRVTTRAGIPPTEMNYRVQDVDGRARVLDAVYLPERLVIELDSASFHRYATDQHDDRDRGNAVLLVGWRGPLRFTWWDLTNRPELVVQRIRTALEAARADSSR